MITEINNYSTSVLVSEGIDNKAFFFLNKNRTHTHKNTTPGHVYIHEHKCMHVYMFAHIVLKTVFVVTVFLVEVLVYCTVLVNNR